MTKVTLSGTKRSLLPRLLESLSNKRTATATKTPLKKSEVSLLQTLSRLFHHVQFDRCWQFVLELSRLYRSLGKEKERRCLAFTSSTYN